VDYIPKKIVSFFPKGLFSTLWGGRRFLQKRVHPTIGRLKRGSPLTPWNPTSQKGSNSHGYLSKKGVPKFGPKTIPNTSNFKNPLITKNG